MINSEYQILEYDKKYRNAVTAIMVRLQEHIISVDSECVQIMHHDYIRNYLDLVLSTIKNNNGIMYLAINNHTPIGLIAGYIEPKDEEDRLTNRCPVRGIVSELFVDETHRRKGIAQSLFVKIEEYFLSAGCEFVAVNVFAPNVSAFEFYKSLGYEERNIEMYKRLE